MPPLRPLPVLPSMKTSVSHRSSEVDKDFDAMYQSVTPDDREPDDIRPITRTNTTASLMRHVRRVGSWPVPFLMMATFLLAVVGTVASHVFASALDGKSVDDYPIPQTWARDLANALAQFVQVFLQASVGIALTQAIWFYVRRSAVTLPELDDLFDLPSILAMPPLLLRFGSLYVLLLAMMIQAFALIGIFAPNALSVVSASPVSSTLSVPYPALDKIPFATSAQAPVMVTGACPDGNCTHHPSYVAPSRLFKTLTQSVLNSGDILPWTAPDGCGVSCNYTVAYSGPALRCTDVPQSSFVYRVTDDRSDPPTWTMTPNATNPALTASLNYSGVVQVYNATTTLGKIEPEAYSNMLTGPVYEANVTSDVFALSVFYSASNFTVDNEPVSLRADDGSALGGTSCVFVNASYSTSVTFTNGSHAATTRVLEYHEPYSPYASSQGLNSSSDYATFGLMDAMTRYLAGSVSAISYAGLAPYFTQAFEGTGLFSISEANGTSITLRKGNSMGVILQGLCANLTASLMSDAANLGIRTTTSATVLPNKTVYSYRPLRLWLVYGIALGVALAADLFGLACMRSSGIAMQRTFSTIAASMRAHELNELLNGPEERPVDAAKAVKLRYRTGMTNESEKSGFVIAEGGNGSEGQSALTMVYGHL